jgi:TctA family transporter
MDLFNHVLLGAQVCFTPMNLLFCFVGVLMGTLVGVLPGLGPTAAIAMLLPNTFHVPPVSAIIMLAGIYYGAMYGGSTTSILVNIRAKRPRSSHAWTGTNGPEGPRRFRIGDRGLRFFHRRERCGDRPDARRPLAKLALAFGPPEYFSLMLMGIVILIYMASGPFSRR